MLVCSILLRIALARCPPWNEVEVHSGRMKYIVLADLPEGISSWRYTISEVLLMARLTNSTLVEPCVRLGKINGGACKEADAVKLTDLYDRDSLLTIGPMISHDEFVAVNASNDFFWHGHYVLRYAGDKGRSGSIYNVATRADVVVMLQLYGKSLCGLDPAIKDAARRRMRFARVHEHYVQSIVSDLNVTGGYNVIQWRSELHFKNISQCAKAVVAMRWLPEFRDKPMVLVSDLNHNASLMWHFMKEHVSQDLITRTLDLLKANDVRKLDDVVQRYVSPLPEPVARAAIWDLLIAAGADHFVTCDDCHNALCRHCCWQGNFAHYIVELRQQNATDTCWLQSRLQKTLPPDQQLTVLH